MSEFPATLAPGRLDGNWKLPITNRQFLVRHLAEDLEEVFAATVRTFLNHSHRRLFLDSRYPAVKDATKALLVISEDTPGHQIATTLLFQRRGNDLFVEISGAAKSCLRWLHKVMRLALIASIFCLIYGAYFRYTGQGDSLLMEYARKIDPAEPSNAFRAMKTGSRLNAEQRWVKTEDPVSMWEILRKDPKLFLMNTAGPPALMLLLIGVAIGLLPPSSFDGLARFIGWPSAAGFTAQAVAEVGSVDADACLVLGEEFGVREGDIRQILK